MAIQIIYSIYRALLHLFPPSYHARFGDEMLDVFSEAVTEATMQGKQSLKELYLNELRDLPVAALRERFGGMRHQTPDIFALNMPGWQRPLPRGEMLLGIAAFLMPAVLMFANSTLVSLPLVSLSWFALAFLAIAFLAGMVKGFPRWSLPYVGMGLCLTGYLFLFQWMADLVSPQLLGRLGLPIWYESTSLVWQVISAGVVWLGLFIITIFFLALLALLPRFRSLYLSIRRDWTQISFVLYSEMAIALILLFEDYRYDEPYCIASLLFMATGAWLFMRSPLPWQRILVLLGGVALAMWAGALDKWLTLPNLKLDTWFRWHPPEIAQRLEGYPALLHWAWMSAVLLLPLLIKVRPRKGHLVDEHRQPVSEQPPD